MLSLSYILFSLLVASSNAANDWSTPCFSGSCQYDLPASNGSASGTMMIWGSSNSISDVTPAAGWEIIDCSPDALKQDIRLVCKDGSDSDCSHLFDGSTNAANAVGKVVRLPENCGQNAFAVVTDSYLHQNQSIPDSAASTLTRRDGTTPIVRGLSLHTTLPTGTPPWGPVSFALKASNVPGATRDLSSVPQQQRRSNNRFMRKHVSNFVDSAISELASRDDININKSADLALPDIDQSFNLLDQSISCPFGSANMKIDAAAKTHAVVTIGVAATGTLVPGALSSFAITGGMHPNSLGLNANLGASITMQASVTGSQDSGTVTLLQPVGIPGLEFPGVLSIGPTFQINGQATANLDLSTTMTVGLSYTISNAQFVFPPNNQQPSGSFTIGDTPLQLSADANGQATGSVVAHVIPTLKLGITALSNTVSANVILALDASATMTLNAGASAGSTVTPRSELFSSFSLLSLGARQDTSGDTGSGDSTNNSQDNTGTDSTDTSQDNSGNTSTDNSGDNSVDSSGDSTTDTNNNPSADGGDNSSTDSTASTSTDSNTPNSDGSDNTNSTDAATGTDTSDSSTANSSNAPDATDSATDNSDTSTGSADTTTADNTGNNTGNTGDNTDSANTDTSATDAAAADTSTVADASTSNASASFGGCFEVVGALDASVGADASFLSFFDASTTVPLFNQQFEILPKKCFGSQAQGVPTRRELRSAYPSRLFSRSQLSSLSVIKRDLSCPSKGVSLQSIIDQTISASQITQK